MRLHLLATVFPLFFLVVTSQRAAKPTQDMPGTKLVSLTNEWTDAINKKDRKKLDELMAPEFALYHWNGNVWASRSEWLEYLLAHTTIEKNTLIDPAPHVYGDVAIVTSKRDWAGIIDGEHFSQKCLVVDTWRSFGGHWQVVGRTSDCTYE